MFRDVGMSISPRLLAGSERLSSEASQISRKKFRRAIELNNLGKELEDERIGRDEIEKIQDIQKQEMMKAAAKNNKMKDNPNKTKRAENNSVKTRSKNKSNGKSKKKNARYQMYSSKEIQEMVFGRDQNSTTRKDERKSLGDFEIGLELGRGKYGTVYKARLKQNKQNFAIKVVEKCVLEKEGMRDAVRHEIEIHSRLRHPNIVRCFDYIDDVKNLYIILEYASQGSLKTVLDKQPFGRFEEPQAANYIAQISLGLHYLHEHNVIHRDIKPENLLIDTDGKLKLADFGWAAHDRKGFQNQRRSTICGTLDYLAPELTNGISYDESVDSWQVGILTFELICGYCPFEPQADASFDWDESEDENSATFRRINSNPLTFPSFLQVSFRCKDLITQLLNREAKLRPNMLRVVNHPWIVAHYNFQKN